MICPFCLGTDFEFIHSEQAVSTMSRSAPIVRYLCCLDCGQHVDEVGDTVETIGEPDLDALRELVHELRKAS